MKTTTLACFAFFAGSFSLLVACLNAETNDGANNNDMTNPSNPNESRPDAARSDGARDDGGGPSDAAAEPRVLVSIGGQGQRMWSTDAKAWHLNQPFPYESPFSDVSCEVDDDHTCLLRSGCYGNGIYLAMSNGAPAPLLLLRSTDGINWTEIERPANSEGWSACAYGHGIFTSGEMWSVDGITWTSIPADERSLGARELIFGGGVFVAVNDKRSVSYSTDGRVWRPSKLPESTLGGFNAVVYGDGRFIAIGAHDNDAGIIESTDGQSWTEQSLNSVYGRAFLPRGIAYGLDRFVITGEDAPIVRMAGSTTWTELTGAPNLSGLVGRPSLLFSMERWSDDGVTWHDSTHAPKDVAPKGVRRILGELE